MRLSWMVSSGWGIVVGGWEVVRPRQVSCRRLPPKLTIYYLPSTIYHLPSTNHHPAMIQPAVRTRPALPWYRTISSEQWRVLLAAKFGWMLDAMDFMLYAMAVGQLRQYFGFNDATAGLLGTVTLVMSGVGGLIFGYVADRFGRTRALMGTIAVFSLASLGAASSQSVVQLLMWRAILGIGMGGEWASGAVLVSETWPAAHRNKAISIMQSGWAIGYILAALMAAAILGSPRLGEIGRAHG